ncbi:MAG: MFS transporter [Terriglobia bacterium]
MKPSQSQSAQPPSHFRWTVVALLCAVAFVLYIDRINIMIAAPHFEKEFDLSSQMMGNVLSAFLFGYALGLVPGGWLTDRFGPHRVLTLAGLSWGALTVLMGCVPKQVAGQTLDSGVVLVLARFLLGIYEACPYPTFNRALANWMRRSERAFSSGLIHCGSGLGGAFTPVFIALIVQHLGVNGEACRLIGSVNLEKPKPDSPVFGFEIPRTVLNRGYNLLEISPRSNCRIVWVEIAMKS